MKVCNLVIKVQFLFDSYLYIWLFHKNTSIKLKKMNSIPEIKHTRNILCWKTYIQNTKYWYIRSGCMSSYTMHKLKLSWITQNAESILEIQSSNHTIVNLTIMSKVWIDMYDAVCRLHCQCVTSNYKNYWAMVAILVLIAQFSLCTLTCFSLHS